LGTAKTNEGMMSRREGRSGIDHADPNIEDEKEGKKAEENGTS